jgi:hypothetical protein
VGRGSGEGLLTGVECGEEPHAIDQRCNRGMVPRVSPPLISGYFRPGTARGGWRVDGTSDVINCVMGSHHRGREMLACKIGLFICPPVRAFTQNCLFFESVGPDL